MKKGTIGIFEREAEIENLAREIYKTHNASVTDSFPKHYMRDSQELREKGCYAIAAQTIDRYFK